MQPGEAVYVDGMYEVPDTQRLVQVRITWQMTPTWPGNTAWAVAPLIPEPKQRQPGVNATCSQGATSRAVETVARRSRAGHARGVA